MNSRPGFRRHLAITGLSLLPAAAAPTVSIDAVADFDEGNTVTLSATLTGGTYDAADHLWAIDSGGGSLDDAAAVTPVYTTADISADDPTISLEITARGTGTDAADGTSDTASDTESFTVRHVADFDLSNYADRSGVTYVIRALFEAGINGDEILDIGNSQGSLLDGDVSFDGSTDLDRIRVRDSGDRVQLIRGAGTNLSTLFGAGNAYEGAELDFQTADGLSVHTYDSAGNAGVHFAPGDNDSIPAGVVDGTRYIVAVYYPPPAAEDHAVKPVTRPLPSRCRSQASLALPQSLRTTPSTRATQLGRSRSRSHP